MCRFKINKSEQINRGRKEIQNSKENQTNIAYQISKDSEQKHGKHPRRDLKMEKFYFKMKTGFVASNLLWKNIER